ncbi:hypothetical protein [Trinickia dinghuensis]|uniref:hypothetical protein n=1 Tax=Trinickia dinghuensis TaxID=2291023 RepID=UPI0011C03900|nr:hypothetical protein [Trinickia dinghuensis]
MTAEIFSTNSAPATVVARNDIDRLAIETRPTLSELLRSGRNAVLRWHRTEKEFTLIASIREAQVYSSRAASGFSLDFAAVIRSAEKM